MKWYIKQKGIVTLEVPMTELTRFLNYMTRYGEGFQPFETEIAVRSITTEG